MRKLITWLLVLLSSSVLADRAEVDRCVQSLASLGQQGSSDTRLYILDMLQQLERSLSGNRVVTIGPKTPKIALDALPGPRQFRVLNELPDNGVVEKQRFIELMNHIDETTTQARDVIKAVVAKGWIKETFEKYPGLGGIKEYLQLTQEGLTALLSYRHFYRGIGRSGQRRRGAKVADFLSWQDVLPDDLRDIPTPMGYLILNVISEPKSEAAILEDLQNRFGLKTLTQGKLREYLTRPMKRFWLERRGEEYVLTDNGEAARARGFHYAAMDF